VSGTPLEPQELMMDITLGSLAFFCLIAAHLLAVVAVHDARWEGEAREPQDLPTRCAPATC
jgi:hypothetical protein